MSVVLIVRGPSAQYSVNLNTKSLCVTFVRGLEDVVKKGPVAD